MKILDLLQLENVAIFCNDKSNESGKNTHVVYGKWEIKPVKERKNNENCKDNWKFNSGLKEN